MGRVSQSLAIMSVTLPAYTPTSWVLTLPKYPAIENVYRSAYFPDVLGSLPSDSRWKLVFENVSNAQALALLLPWRATGCGILPLSPLPAELAGGVDNADFRKRLTGTTWTIEKEPTLQPVKNNRFTVTVDLIYELTFASVYGVSETSPPPTLAGFPGFIDTDTKWQLATVYDWDRSLKYPPGITPEGPGYPVDGSVGLRATSSTAGTCVRSTGIFVEYFTLGQAYTFQNLLDSLAIAGVYFGGFSNLVSNTVRCIPGLPVVQIELSNS